MDAMSEKGMATGCSGRLSVRHPDDSCKGCETIAVIGRKILRVYTGVQLSNSAEKQLHQNKNHKTDKHQSFLIPDPYAKLPNSDGRGVTGKCRFLDKQYPTGQESTITFFV